MLGGLFACGLTHTAVVPLDIVKCRIQANPEKYSGLIKSFRQILAAEGTSWMRLGWLPTFIGYSAQGACKFGFYEVFKDFYGGIVGQEFYDKNRKIVWAAASASAEFIADVALCPFEAVKVRVQTSEAGSFPSAIGPAFQAIKSKEGWNGLYKGLGPLWGRQVPYTIMKFVVFEATVAHIYESVLKCTRADCSRGFNLSMTFLSGYIAGVACAIISHPADTLFTALNKSQSEGSLSDNVKRIYAKIGFGGLWKGLGPRIIMVGTLTGLQWWIYDSFKTAVGLQATGGAAKAK
jgi:solute carrier family 25 phosphate transporter 3